MASFKTLKKTRAVIIEQPVPYFERYKSGKNVGKVKRKRQIQYNKELDTIFVDEQRQQVDDPKPTTIYITKSVLKVDDKDLPMIEFLMKHRDNEINGGTLFKLVDVEKDELYEIQQYEEKDKARHLLNEADDNLIRTIAVWFLGIKYITHRIQKLKITLRTKLDMNFKMADGKTDFSTALIEFFEEKNYDEKLAISIALKEGIIKISGNGKTICWGDSDDAIYVGSQAQDIIREISIWVKNDEEGRKTLKLISDKISNLKPQEK